MVEGQFARQTAEPVFQRAIRNVVQGREVFSAQPGAGVSHHETAFGSARIDDLLGEGFDFFPGRGSDFGIEAGGFEHVLVVVEDRGRGVERHRKHVAFGVGVIAGDDREEGGGIEIRTVVGHQLVNRIDGARGSHHRAGAHFVDLYDMGLLIGAEGGDGVDHRFLVFAAIGRNHDVFVLAGVEIVGNAHEAFAELAAHRMPPVDFGLGKSRRGAQSESHGGGAAGQKCLFHDVLPIKFCLDRIRPVARTTGQMPRPDVQSSGDDDMTIA